MSSRVEALMRQQDGVVSRRQLRELEISDNDIERLVRRREWARVFPGVYVEHTGPLTWNQRAWAAVLCAWPAALADGSALHAHGLRGHTPTDNDPIVVCVDRSRSVSARPGIAITYLSGAEAKSHMHLSPPRQRVEHAVLGEASGRRRNASALGVVADACSAGCAKVARLRSGTSTISSATQWSSSTAGSATRAPRTAGPTSTATWRPQWPGDLTLRVGWKQVLDECRLAAIVAQILVRRGWEGRPRPCGAACAVATIDWSGSSAPGADDLRQIEVA